MIGFPDPDSPDTLEQDELIISSELTQGEGFIFVFDLGDDWAHHCRVEGVDADPKKL